MTSYLPNFSKIDLSQVEVQLDNLLQSNLQRINTVLLTQTEFTWDNLMEPLEDMENKLHKFWSPIAHIHAVVNSSGLRQCYANCLPKLSAYEMSISQNEKLYKAIKGLNQAELNSIQKKIVQDTLLDFKLSGVNLSSEKKAIFEQMQTRLSNLTNLFENNVLDATQAFSMHIVDKEILTGLPQHVIVEAQESAQQKGLNGWLLNLEYPCYLAIMTYAQDRALRETIYRAYITRASDQQPSQQQFDNTKVMEEILSLRQAIAKLLGFNNYAELSLISKMAKELTTVYKFLNDLCARVHQQAETEFTELQQFALNEYGLNKLSPWDITYITEKKRQKEYAISQEDLRPYLPLTKVLDGLFVIVKKLYGIEFVPEDQVDLWDPQVKCYRLLDETKQTRGYIYMDLFVRLNKRAGAWMDALQGRYRNADGEIQLPIATLTCNFTKPTTAQPALLSHEELLTLFHELGHCLQHLLTRIDYLSASGINGIEWDAVELPSQFFENWCWEESALRILSKHIATNEPIANKLFKKLLAIKNFNSAMLILRQVEFALFDLTLHDKFTAQEPGLIEKILHHIRKQTAVVPIAGFNRFQHSFSHIFSGGYAAGYYSYLWAEILSSDAFARFEEEGIFNPQTGRDFLATILEVGGSQKAAEAYVNFRGRPATIDALLRHRGIQ